MQTNTRKNDFLYLGGKTLFNIINYLTEFLNLKLELENTKSNITLFSKIK